MQRSPALAAREGGIGGAGAFPRLVDLPDNDRVERGIMPFRARQIEVEQFDTADAPVANFGRQLGCRCKRAIIHALSALPRRAHRSSFPGSEPIVRAGAAPRRARLIRGSVKLGKEQSA